MTIFLKTRSLVKAFRAADLEDLALMRESRTFWRLSSSISWLCRVFFILVVIGVAIGFCVVTAVANCLRTVLSWISRHWPDPVGLASSSLSESMPVVAGVVIGDEMGEATATTLVGKAIEKRSE